MATLVEYTKLSGGHLLMLTDHVKDDGDHQPPTVGVEGEERPSWIKQYLGNFKESFEKKEESA